MPVGMSIKLPWERGEQLSNFADALGISHSDAVGLLLDHAHKAGLTEELSLPGFGVTRDGERFDISISGFTLRGLSNVQAESFAVNLDAVASRAGAIVLDMDQPRPVEMHRRGNGVILSLGPVESRYDVSAEQRALLSCGVAKAIAKRICQKINERTADVEKLLADLELGEDA